MNDRGSTDAFAVHTPSNAEFDETGTRSVQAAWVELFDVCPGNDLSLCGSCPECRGVTTGAGVDVCSALARPAAASPTTGLVRHNAPGAGRAAALAFRRARV
jgi:hypothetical protein